jgi:hypothetical protein
MCVDITLMRELENKAFQDKIVKIVRGLGWDCTDFSINTYMELASTDNTVLYIMRCSMLRHYREFCIYKEDGSYVVGMRGVWAMTYESLAHDTQEKNIVLRSNRKWLQQNHFVPKKDYTFPTIDLVLKDILNEVSYFVTKDKEIERLRFKCMDLGLTYDKNKDLILAKSTNSERTVFEYAEQSALYYAYSIEEAKNCPKD